MLATETKATAAPPQAARIHQSRLSWKQIVTAQEPFLKAVNRRLAEQVQAFDTEIASYASYALTGQGKQLRPALVALSGGATGKTDEPHEEVAVIIEMVHLATLVR